MMLSDLKKKVDALLKTGDRPVVWDSYGSIYAGPLEDLTTITLVGEQEGDGYVARKIEAALLVIAEDCPYAAHKSAL